jgi:uncharacterized protein YbjT (DUF2867 family)
MQRTILITGATGSVAGALIDELSGQPVALRGLVRDSSKAEALQARGVTPVAGDLDDPGSLTAAFEGVDDLFLVNAVGPRAPENSMNALWAARQAGVQRVVRLSAVGAAHDAPTRNGRLHALSDRELEASGVNFTVLRPHFFMQNLLMGARSIAADGVFYEDMADARLGMIDVRDIAAFGARVLLDDPELHRGKTYTPTGPESVSFAEVAARMSETFGRAVRYEAIPHAAMHAAMLGMGFSKWLADMMIEYGKAYASSWGDFTTPDFERVVGRKARNVAAFLRDNAAIFGGSPRSSAA